MNKSPFGIQVARLAFAVSLLIGTVACSGTAETGSGGSPPVVRAADAAGDTGTTVAPVGREILGMTEAAEAPGFTEYLIRVVIQPGVKLPTHRHPGTQISRIEAGELTYTLVSGSTDVARNGASTPSEHVSAPNVLIFHAGDTVYENETLVHYAENNGAQPVAVVQASLLKTGEPPSIDVKT